MLFMEMVPETIEACAQLVLVISLVALSCLFFVIANHTRRRTWMLFALFSFFTAVSNGVNLSRDSMESFEVLGHLVKWAAILGWGCLGVAGISFQPSRLLKIVFAILLLASLVGSSFLFTCGQCLVCLSVVGSLTAAAALVHPANRETFRSIRLPISLLVLFVLAEGFSDIGLHSLQLFLGDTSFGVYDSVVQAGFRSTLSLLAACCSVVSFSNVQSRWVMARISIAVVLALAFSYFWLNFSADKARRIFQQQLLYRVSSVANSLDLQNVKEMVQQSKNAYASAFNRTLRQLMQVRSIYRDVMNLYIVRIDLATNRVVFILDSSAPDSTVHAPPGTVYSEAPLLLHDIASYRNGDTFGPYTDRWGHWYSGFAPILTESGDAIAVVGMDLDGKDYIRAVSRGRFEGMFAAAMFWVVVGLVVYTAERWYAQLDDASDLDLPDSSRTDCFSVESGVMNSRPPLVPLSFTSDFYSWHVSTFRPLKSGVARRVPDVEVSGPASMKILLVEDSESIRMLFQHYLKESPHSLTCAVNGRESVERVKHEPFDIIFMDMEMPVMNGFEATRRIREFESHSRRQPVPIVLLTAHSVSSTWDEAHSSGCTDFLPKPVRPGDLEKLLSKYC